VHCQHPAITYVSIKHHAEVACELVTIGQRRYLHVTVARCEGLSRPTPVCSDKFHNKLPYNSITITVSFHAGRTIVPSPNTIVISQDSCGEHGLTLLPPRPDGTAGLFGHTLKVPLPGYKACVLWAGRICLYSCQTIRTNQCYFS
jgi:hypothetical protein